jgi:trehalose 6-phosphate phosphatase
MSLAGARSDDPRLLAAHLAALAEDRPLLVALDHDGTLSPIAPRPEAAVLAPGAREALAALADVPDLDVAIISGRGLDDLTARLGDLGVTLVAEHGLRRRSPDGQRTQLAPGLATATLDALRATLARLLAEDAARDGWIVEDKGVGLAVHHRLVAADRLEPTLGAVRAALEAAAAHPCDGGPPDVPGGQVQAGKAVLELRAAGADKGAALTRLLAERPGTLAVMVGDDATDEPAFVAAQERGGIGVLVGTPDTVTAASAVLADPDAVVALLGALVETLGDGRDVSRG